MRGNTRESRNFALPEFAMQSGPNHRPTLEQFEFPTIKALSPAERKQLAGIGGSTPLLDYLRDDIERQTRVAIGGATSAGSSECLLREISAGISKDMGQVPSHGGIWFPLIFASGLSTKTDGDGGFTVGTKVPDLIEPLRAKNVFLRSGAQLFDGVSGRPLFPAAQSGTAAYWMGEDPGSDVAATAPVFRQVVPRPHNLQATATYSRQLLIQSSPGLESFLRTDLMAAHARALDQAAISGPGSENQPLGLLGLDGIQSVELGSPDGGAPTAAKLLELEAAISNADADVSPIAWIVTPSVKEYLKQTAIAAGITLPCWQNDRLLDSPALASRAVPSNLVKGANSDCAALIAGSFNQAAIVVWGAIEIMVDVFAQKRQGLVEITSWMAADVIFLRKESFGAIQGAHLG